MGDEVKWSSNEEKPLLAFSLHLSPSLPLLLTRKTRTKEERHGRGICSQSRCYPGYFFGLWALALIIVLPMALCQLYHVTRDNRYCTLVSLDHSNISPQKAHKKGNLILLPQHFHKGEVRWVFLLSIDPDQFLASHVFFQPLVLNSEISIHILPK